MQIKNITVSVVFYGNQTYLSYVGIVSDGPLVDVIIPMGSEATLFVNNNKYFVTMDIPSIIYYRNGDIEIIDKFAYDNVMLTILRIVNDNNMPIFEIDGIKIPLIKKNDILSHRIDTSILIRDRPPKQDVVRVFVDVSDQLLNGYPNIDTKITFIVRGIYPQKDKNEMSHVVQISLPLLMKYDTNNIYFNSDICGAIGYDMITGKFSTALSEKLKKYLADRFKSNYPDTLATIYIYLIAIDAKLNYRSIIYN